MINLSDDAALLRRQRQFLHELERSVREANRAIIHARIPELDQQRFVELAERVAQLRASYLECALAGMAGGEPSVPVAELRQHREAYEEATHAFDALQRAIERGYVEIGFAAEAATR